MEWSISPGAVYYNCLVGRNDHSAGDCAEGAVYADRKFLWRLSSAQVELEHSDFTPLPDYDRLISVLKGELELKIGQGERGALEACTVRGFDGGVPVESWGRCVDSI